MTARILAQLLSVSLKCHNMPDKSKMLEQLAIACSCCGMCDLGWQKVKRDYQTEEPQVPGWRDCATPLSKFVVVGQNPGWDEVLRKEPFVGKSGENFLKAITKHGGRYMIDRSSFYITNVVKCYTTGNSAPQPHHIKSCSPYLQMELAIIKPTLVISLGAVAFGALCPGLKFSSSLGKITKSDVYGVKVYATHHPSPLNLQDAAKATEFDKHIRVLCELMFRQECPW
jgi:uracil-DNA glycosylase family 4